MGPVDYCPTCGESWERGCSPLKHCGGYTLIGYVEDVRKARGWCTETAMLIEGFPLSACTLPLHHEGDHEDANGWKWR